MKLLPLWVGVCISLPLAAAEKRPITARATNVNVSIQARAFTDRNEVKQMLGSDFGGSVVVVEVRITPRAGKELKIFQDDFLLRSYKDGQKSEPFAPAELAGSSVLQLSTTAQGGAVMAQEQGPVWGGIGGGRPGRLGGNGSGVGNSATQEGVQAKVSEENKGKDSPLLTTLKEKVLPEKETAEPLSGLLYFPLDGKHKAKDLALVYSGAGGKLTLEFQQ
jgi:hypothetical protein